MSEVKGWSIESLHLKCRIDKKGIELVKRFARVLVAFKNEQPTYTYQVIDKDGKWSEVEEADFHSETDNRRAQLLKDLKAELVKKVNEKVKKK